MAPKLRWSGDDALVVGGTEFQILPESYNGGEGVRKSGAEFLVAKPRWMIERYVELIDELHPQRVLELGVYHGGSTVLLAELARPEALVAIDALPLRGFRKRIAEKPGIADAVRIHGRVDQGDREKLREIVRDEFGDRPLDLVVDDCSHFYGPTRASFNELFPRLRPGGVYVVEDWSWAHAPSGIDPSALEAWYPGETPLTKLLYEAILALPFLPGFIDDIRVHSHAFELRRGEAEVDPETFDVAAASAPRGRRLLSPD